nr:uncharacterized protein LOC129281530 [Lytechinus pictus]
MLAMYYQTGIRHFHYSEEQLNGLNIYTDRHRHHSTGQSYGPYSTNSPRGNLRNHGSSPAIGRDTILVEASTYRQMVQDLSSMKTALGKLSRMLQDPKALQDMLAVCQPDAEKDPGLETMDNMTQCEQIPVQEGENQTDYVQLDSKVPVQTREAASQSESMQRENRGVQSDITFTVSIYLIKEIK